MRLPVPFKILFTGSNNSIQPILKKLVWLTIVLLLALYLVFTAYFNQSSSYAIFTVTSVIGAYYLMGSAVGFIFAIPKSFQGKQTITSSNDTLNGDTTFKFRDNTSLEEISDWITKIIIGLSLTQFNKIQDMLKEAAANLSNAITQAAVCSNGFCATNFLPFSYAIIVLYGTLGLMTGYLWTRIEFPKILTRRDYDINKIQQEAFIKTDVNDPNSERYKSFGLSSSPLVDTGNKQMMQNIVNETKPGPIADDPQKGRWGGKSEFKNRKVAATVTQSLIPGFFTVKIIVSSTDNSSLGEVGVVLHPSFNPILRVLDAGEAKEVYTEVLAYEAFTLGVLCDVHSETDYTALELDLNTLSGLPKKFYWS